MKTLFPWFFALCLGLAGCGGPIAVGAVQPKPYFAKPAGSSDGTITVVLAPGIRDSFQVTNPSFRPIDLSAYRSSVEHGLRAALQSAFSNVQLATEVPASDLTLSVLRFEPKTIKVGDTNLGGQKDSGGTTVYELKFQIAYDAALLRNGAEVARTSGVKEGDESSWKASDNSRLLENALEVATTTMLGELFGKLGAAPPEPATEAAAAPATP